MVQLGRFHRTETGYAGRIATLTVTADLRIEPAAPQTNDRAPDHRIYAGEAECGAAWTPEEETGAVLYVKIDDPAFAAPIRGRLVPAREDEDQYFLLWRRSPGD
jgi:uncharacterized protein (DUF736 family)